MFIVVAHQDPVALLGCEPWLHSPHLPVRGNSMHRTIFMSPVVTLFDTKFMNCTCLQMKSLGGRCRPNMARVAAHQDLVALLRQSVERYGTQ